jgi:hypothetical protein
MNSVATYDSLWFFTIIEISLVHSSNSGYSGCAHAVNALHITTAKIAEPRRKANEHSRLFQEHELGSRARRLRLVRNTQRLSGRANSQIQNLERRS